jgi:hypothetical protein
VEGFRLDYQNGGERQGFALWSQLPIAKPEVGGRAISAPSTGKSLSFIAFSEML